MKKQSRRTFIRLANVFIFALIIFLWNKLTLKHIHKKSKKDSVFPLNLNKAVSFHDNYIVINKSGEIKVLAAECTHMGCKIQEIRKGRLVCPCHGSEYDFDGNPLKGPAFKPLKEIQSKISIDKTTIEIIS